MYGIIDIGSNTMRLSCYRIVEKELIEIFHKKCMAGLAGYVDDNHFLTEKGIQKAIEILEDFKNIIMCVGLDKFYVIATASLRNVKNTEKIVQQILERTGIVVEVLSGEEEAMYDFKGATHQVSSANGMVVDIGGGSTELVCFQNKRVDQAISIPIGSLNTFSKYVEKLFPTEKEEKEIREQVCNKLRALGIERQKVILGVGGTNRACMKLYNDYFDLKSTNVEMKCSKVSELLAEISNGKKSSMRWILKIAPDRIHTIIPGMIILDEICKYYDSNIIELSSWGVREGYMLEKVL